MFFPLSKVLDVLLAPLTWALLLLGAAVLLRRRGAAPWLAAAAGLVLWVFSTDAASNAIMRAGEASAHRTARPDVTYDAVVVLGGGIDTDASDSSDRPELDEAGDRLVAGVELLRAGRAPFLLYTGGTPDTGGMIEADRAAQLFRALGVPEERIVLERASRNTRENATETARIARERGWRSLLLVTSALHAPRALAAFRRAGLSPDVLPVDVRAGAGARGFLPRASALQRSTDAIRELAGRLVYRLVGYSRP